MQVDFLIIGQGLAGSLLARELRRCEKSVLIVDDGWKSAASRVAAGLMTPLTGRRFTLTPDYPALFDVARRKLESLGVFRPAGVYRMFVDDEQRTRGLGRATDSACAPFISRITQHPGELDANLADAFGGCLMKGAWVDLPRFLEETRQQLQSEGLYRVDHFEPQDVVVGATEVVWKDIQASGLIYCDGYKSSQRGPFRYLPWTPAKGEVLNVTSDAPSASFVLNREGWALPLGEGRWRTGTNWQWDDLSEVPTEPQREKLLGRFRGYFNREVTTEVTAHTAGVRPCTSDNHPFIGTHPQYPRLHLFNGMGPRGSVWAPMLAEEMANYLCLAKPLRPDCDLRRFPA